MQLTSYTFDPQELQEMLNCAKDELIDKINCDHGTQLNPCEYVFVLQVRGCLGRMWDKILGKRPEDETRRVLLRVYPPNDQITGPKAPV